MHQIAVIPQQPSELATLAETEMRSALRYAEEARAPATRRAYASDWRCFSAWCAERGLQALPASGETLARFVAAEADKGLAAATIGRRVAAIAHAHALAEHTPPGSSKAVRTVLAGIRRAIGTAPARKKAATASLVTQMLAHCSDTLTGKRDRALIALGFAGAFRRSELVGLTVEDLTETQDGLRVLIRRSKGDQTGQGQEIAIPRGSRIRPVEAVEAWLDAAQISAGPIFRPIARGGRIQDAALSGFSAAVIVKRQAALAGIDPATIGAHSLRSGFLTSGSEAGASLAKLLDVSRHKSADTVLGYIRSAEAFRDHAGGSFL